MLPLQQNYYHATTGSTMDSSSNPNGVVEEGGDSSTLVEECLESKSKSKSHKEAERRRRHRINAHLSTLRSLLPNTIKTDKASLLAEVVSHVKELKKQAADVARNGNDERGCSSLPAELDEATLTSYSDNDCDPKSKLLKATVCCEDRPGLNRDLTRAIRSVRARPVRAEMVTLGGRAKSVVVLKWPNGDEQFRALKRALKAVVENRTAHVLSGKRARVFSSVDYEGCDDFIL